MLKLVLLICDFCLILRIPKRKVLDPDPDLMKFLLLMYESPKILCKILKEFLQNFTLQ